ncbi:MATE family efflux transporter [Flavobacterium sp. K5-23]|uniref:MATE family efflux transporter n=1 Tax=Flavobacterium sp. K5-23 TaxID=2746225 RepID=UPI0020105CB6|nr:MATE family efflux transporter [Flavobacterium sp. K5-23]UQD55567.1 polysaccharide biosynthesis C-terminal domain-containing protein [Flavobacterium sp. K5-23]
MNIISSNLQKIRENPFIFQSVTTLLFRVFGVVILFGFTLFLTKNFTPKTVGQYDFVRSFLLVIGSICLLGCDQSILYFSGRIKGVNGVSDIKNTYKKMVGIVFSMSILIFLVILCIDKQYIDHFFSDPAVHPMLLKSSGVLFFYSITTLNTEVFRALDRLYVAEIFRNTIKYIPMSIGAIIVFYYYDEHFLIDVFLIGFLILAFVTSGLLYYYLKKLPGKNEVNSFTYKEIVTKSYPIAISGMALFLLMSLDILFLKKYLNDEAVAFYALSVKLMTIISMVIITVNITVSTKIAEYFSSNDAIKLASTVRNSSRLIFLLTFPAALIVCFFSEEILGFFGKEYIAAQQALIILMIGQVICSAFGSAPVYLNMTGRQKNFQVILLIAVCINFVLNRFLIPEFGLNGAAIAFVASSIFWNLVSALIIVRKDKVKVFLH